MKFEELETTINERIQKIQRLRQEVPSLLAIDEELHVIIDIDSRKHAAEIVKQIGELRTQNESDMELLAKARSVGQKWNLSIDTFHRLGHLEASTQSQISKLKAEAERYKINLGMRGTIEKQIAEHENRLKALVGAKKDLKDLI